MRRGTVVETDGDQAQAPVLRRETLAQRAAQRRELLEARGQEHGVVVERHWMAPTGGSQLLSHHRASSQRPATVRRAPRPAGATTISFRPE
ncbi:hypothetical protein [Tahibacter caeni]|uniref:hypothetical protein n=1 Tax=Tahibacter caeni TaxID=1453545 RepID=UPI0021483780